MLIWILAVVILGLVAALGFLQGAVSLLISLVGLILGAMLAFPLGPTLKPLIVMAGVKHPVWLYVLPPILVFLLTYIIFSIIAFAVHRKVALYYKYKTDDVTRLRWEHMNKGLGLALGTVAGAVWVLLIGLVIYVAGYFTVQMAGADSNHAAFRYLSKAREDLKTSGLEKSVAALDPMPAVYYQSSDILGLLYHNPILMGRLSAYPPFLTLGQRQEFQDMKNNTEFNNLILSKGDVAEIIRNPQTQAIVYNQEILDELLRQDLNDLRVYLETGVSPKFAEEKILGKWKLDAYATLAQVRKKNPDLRASEMSRIKKALYALEAATDFMATTDNKAIVKVSLSTPAPPPEAAPAENPSGMSADLANRYGMRPSTPTAARPAATAAPAAPTGPALSSGEGTWQRNGSKYELKVPDDQGREHVYVATAEEDRLIVQSSNNTFVFAKAE